MVQEPVATAASNNPLLGTLVTAVGEAGLVDTLNDAEALTVFAPTDDAFGAIPEDTLNAVLADKDTLTSILTYHVVGASSTPEAVVGKQETLQGGTVNVKGDTDGMTVNNANVLCGNIPTATPRCTSSTPCSCRPDRHPSGRVLLTGTIDTMSEPTSLPPGPHTGAPARPDLADLLRASARGDQAAFAQLYDATSSRVHGLALRVVPRPGAGRGGHPGGLPRDLADRRQVRRLPGQRPELVAHADPPQGGRPGPVGRGGLPPRHHVPPPEPARRPRRHRRAGQRSLEARRVEGRSPASPPSSARPSSWRTSGDTPTPRSPPCSSFPSGPRMTRIRDGLIRLRDAMGVGQ